MKVFAALVFFLGYSLAQAQTGPIHTPQINTTYYVGAVSGFYPTIQSAVTKACSANAATVDIPAGSTPGDTIASVTGGCSTVAIVDERGGSGFSNYAWNGTNYVIVPIASAAGGNYSIQYANGAAFAGANFSGPVWNNGNASPPTVETQAQARTLIGGTPCFVSQSCTLAQVAASALCVPACSVAEGFEMNNLGSPLLIGAHSNMIYFSLDNQGVAQFGVNGAGNPFITFNTNHDIAGNFNGATTWAMNTTTGEGTFGFITLKAATSTTSATGGGASALPATPTGYMTISINGTSYKMPYYAP